MDRSLKWRTVALLVGLLLCAGLLAPTQLGTSSLPSWFPFKKKISLGLDLQGGMHIVYSIDLDKAVDDKASDIKRDLEARFIDEKVDAKVKTPAKPLGAVVVTVADSKKKAEIESLIRSRPGLAAKFFWAFGRTLAGRLRETNARMATLLAISKTF